MQIVCCGRNQNKLEQLCNHSFCTILERRKDCRGTLYYQISINLDDYLEWLNKQLVAEICIFTNPEIWVNRKKVSLAIKINSCQFLFFDLNYSSIKDKLKSFIVI